MKKILITSGGTREYIDSVRIMTNISSGALGAKIAEKFLFSQAEDDIHYVAPKTAVMPEMLSKGMFLIYENYYYHEVSNVQSVYDKMKELVPQMDIIIHCMAVSDFGFKPCFTKLKSNDPMLFIESLKRRIYQTPKILKEIKTWNPDCKLISFKFEVGLDYNDLIEVATRSKIENKCDLVIANDKKQMVEAKEHIAFAIGNDNITVLSGKDKIADYIFEFVK